MSLLTTSILVIRYSIDTYLIKKLNWKMNHIRNYIEFIIIGITILVLAIPEGLPLAVTIALAYSIKKMMDDKILVRHLDACETMGNATAICSDKTGTLTTNRMTVVQSYIGDRLFVYTPKSAEIDPITIKLLAKSIAYNCSYTSKIVVQKEGLPLQIGNKTECSLLSFIEDLGENYQELRKKIPEELFYKVYTFNSIRKFMATIVRFQNGLVLFIKGASEIVLDKCNWIMNAKGDLKSLSKNDIKNIKMNIIKNMAEDGLRTICLAFKLFNESQSKTLSKNLPSDLGDVFGKYPTNSLPSQSVIDYGDSIFDSLICISIVGIEDPVRPEVPLAIKLCQQAGITVRMVTGDNIITATTIARKCGILPPGNNYLVLEGKEFDKAIRIKPTDGINQELFDLIWPNLRVLARSSPQDKFNLVSGILNSNYKNTKQVVAVTGDGTNDGPALKKADVGFAMGLTGTDVAKIASDIILVDDNFASIVKSVMWGRNVYDSIAKFLQFQLTVNFVALLITFLGACFIECAPIKPIQMLYINLVMDSLASLALATERPTKDMLNRKPYQRTKSIISSIMLRNIIGHSLYQLIVLLFLIFAAHDLLDYDYSIKMNSDSVHFTLVYNTFVMMTLFNEINSRKIHNELNVFIGLDKNYVFIVIWTLTFVIQILLVQFGCRFFSTKPLPIELWLWSLVFGVGELFWYQVVRIIPMGIFNIVIEKASKRYKSESFHSYRDIIKQNRKLSFIRGVHRLQLQMQLLNTLKEKGEASPTNEISKTKTHKRKKKAH